MPHEEREGRVDTVLAGCEHLGATVVGDDQTLCRLLRTMELFGVDRDIGEYLCSFLVA